MNITKKYQLTDEQHENLKKIYNWLNEEKDLDQSVEERKVFFLMLIKSVMGNKEYHNWNIKRLNQLVEEYNKNRRTLKIKQ